MRPQARPRRTRWLACIAIVVVVASTGGYLVGSQVRSPQDVLASSEAPDDSVLTAPVTRGRVSGQESFVAGVRWRSTRAIRLSGSGGELGAVVTGTPMSPGDVVEPGTLLLTVSDRPVIVLDGVVPMLRDLRLGDTGPDVARLQDGLRDADYFDGSSDGVFGSATLAALGDVYDANGYQLPTRQAASEGERPRRPVTEGYAAASEIVFVPKLPVVLLRYDVPIGETVGDAVAEVGVDGLAVQADVPSTWHAALDGRGPGAAQVRVRLSGRTYDGVVSALGAPRIVEDQGEVVSVTVQTRGRALAPSLDGARAELILSERAAPTGLRVPLSALYSSSDVGDFVRVAVEDDVERVPVRIVATRDGVAIVTPGVAGALTKGDEVVIGVDRVGS